VHTSIDNFLGSRTGPNIDWVQLNIWNMHDWANEYEYKSARSSPYDGQTRLAALLRAFYETGTTQLGTLNFAFNRSQKLSLYFVSLINLLAASTTTQIQLLKKTGCSKSLEKHAGVLDDWLLGWMLDT
jgi:hypothetical protein